MSLTIEVQVSVVNEDGNITNHKGHVCFEHDKHAQKTVINMVTHDTAQEANASLNRVHDVLTKIKELIHGQ